MKLILTPDTSAMFNRAGMLTMDGRCKTLDAAADGYVRGEAVVALVLQQLADAPKSDALSASTMTAMCCLVSSAVNQDGRSSTLTAPNGPAQQTAVRQALSSGGLAAATVAMVQLHGTGTPLGDPIEVGALAAVLGAARSRAAAARQVVLAAGKTSMGHTEPAAGMVGVAHAAQALAAVLVQPILHLHKVCLCCPALEWLACTRPPQPRSPRLWACDPPACAALPFLQLNPYMEGSVSAANSGLFAITRELGGFAGLATPLPSLAGTSSFAFQGTNAHALISPAADNGTSTVGILTPIWKRQYVNVVPPAHVQVCQCLAFSPSVLLNRVNCC